MDTPIRITICSPKGHIGKTTLAANVAFALSLLGKNVLLVDGDPQCGLTSYLLPDDRIDDLLAHSDNENGRTIWSAVRPVIDNAGSVRLIDPTNIGEVALLPSDIRLIEFEEFLKDAWAGGLRRQLDALRALSSISQLISTLAQQRNIDFVLYDTGSNIGALNRVLLLDSDFFIVPVACDPFSSRVLSTLAQAVKKWIIDAETIDAIAPDGAMKPKARPRFLGYVFQGFNVFDQPITTKTKSHYEHIKDRVREHICSVLKSINQELAPSRSVDLLIGQVQDLSLLVQTAQREGVAIWNCSVPENNLKQEAKDSFLQVAERIVGAVSRIN